MGAISRVRCSVLAVACLLLMALSAPALAGQLLVRQASKEVALTGYTRGEHSQRVTSEVAARVRAVNYEVGDVAGEKPFIELDTSFMDYKAAAIEASLRKLDAMQSKARSHLAFLKKQHARIDALHREERATDVRLDEASEALEQATMDLESLSAERETLKANLDELRERISRHSISVPEGWIITGRLVEPGEVIQPGMPLGRATDFGRMVVPLSVSADELYAIERLPARFSAYIGGKAVEVEVKSINPEFNEQTRKTDIELLVLDYAGHRRGGLRFSLPIRIRAEGVLVPASAVNERYENPTVRLKSDGSRIPVMVAGQEGDFILVSDSPRLAPGVELMPAESRR